MTSTRAAAAAAAMMALLVAPASAQPEPSAATPPAQPPVSARPADGALQLAQPDFTLVALPTGLRLPARKFAFRVTHRFRRSLGQGSFGDLASDAFGLDNGAITGLELRFGLLPGTQVGVHRTGLGKTVQFFAEHEVIGRDRFPFDVSAYASLDGTNNFQDSYRPALGAVLTRVVGDIAALYLEPMWINNTNELPSEVVDDNNTVIFGLGGRLRVTPATYFVIEWSPRVAGFEPGVDAVAFAVERRIGGHVFQINFSNSFATTMGQIGRGGFTNDDWYLGFNITRKFF